MEMVKKKGGKMKEQVPKEIVKQCDMLQEVANEIVVKDEETCVEASNWLVRIAEVKKEIESRRKFFVKPLQDHVKRINALFKEYTSRLEKLDKVLRKKITDYKISTEEPTEKTTKTEGGRVTVTERWVFDIENEKIIPREYLKVDEKKIREAIDAGIRSIPGVKIYKDTRLSVFTRK